MYKSSPLRTLGIVLYFEGISDFSRPNLALNKFYLTFKSMLYHLSDNNPSIELLLIMLYFPFMIFLNLINSFPISNE